MDYRWGTELLGGETDLAYAADIDVDGNVLAYPSAARAPVRTVVDALKGVLRQAQLERISPGPVMILSSPVRGRETEIFSGLFGDDGSVINPPVVFTSPKVKFPFLQRIFRRFKASEPKSKEVRIDTEESYARFCAPRLTQMSAKIEELKSALQRHIEEDDSRFSDLRVQGLVEDVSLLRERARGREAISLQLPPQARDKISCWQDGDEIFCSVRLLGPDGRVRIATASTPVSVHIDEIFTYMENAEVDPVDLLSVLPTLTQMFGGSSLVPLLASAAPLLLIQPEVMEQVEPFFAGIVPADDSALASVMTLQQETRRGNEQARRELLGLTEAARLPGGEMIQVLLTEGAARLTEAYGGRHGQGG